jgi:hypothetical protein
MTEQETLRQILDLEWDMFHTVQGIDGPAPCQDDRRTFEVMRSSQLLSWPEEAAASYLVDLERADAQGRNLMTEKYARMMEYTSPCEFRRIAGGLPVLEAEAVPLIERLTQRSVGWMEELAATYPYVAGRGRPIRSTADNPHLPSFETYTRGELATYSVRALRLHQAYYDDMAAQGRNPAALVLEHTAAASGYPSLERAEEVQRERAEKNRDRHD